MTLFQLSSNLCIPSENNVSNIDIKNSLRNFEYLSDKCTKQEKFNAVKLVKDDMSRKYAEHERNSILAL